jgi:hypothetical protein
MINSRLSRDTKFSASSRDEIIKSESERFKKMIKSKTLVNSRSSRRDLENVETTSISFRFVVDSKSFIIFAFFIAFTSTFFIIVVSTFFVTFVSISFVTLFLVSASFDESTQNSIFEEMNRNVLIRLLTTLIFSSFESSNVFVADIVANSLSIRISIFMIEFVVIIAEKSTTLNEFSDFDEFFVKKKERRRNFLRKMKSHEQRRIIDDFFVFVLISTRDFISFVTRVSMSFRNVVISFAFSRISKTSRRRNVVETKFDESFITRFVVEKKNENEFIDENDDEFSNCVKCCRVSMFCRRVNDIACARCLKQKQACVSIYLRFTFFEDFLLITVDFYSI